MSCKTGINEMTDSLLNHQTETFFLPFKCAGWLVMEVGEQFDDQHPSQGTARGDK
jgi:hypothetical protein